MAELQQSNAYVLPGDIINIHGDEDLRLGLGILQDKQGIIATRGGYLRRNGFSGSSESRPLIWVDSTAKRYTPQIDDMVIGTILEKKSEYYKLDIKTSHPAILSAIAFEGATRRNKPNLEVGDSVYCRVAVCNKFMELELSCMSPHFKKDWVTGESIFGELKEGFVIPVSIRFAHELMDDNNVLLNTIGSTVNFEIAIGVNGLVWINSSSVRHTIIICNILQKYDSDRTIDAGTMLEKAMRVLIKE